MLSRDERKTFQTAYARVVEFGSGEFDPDLPKAIKVMAVKLNGSRATTGTDRLLLGVVARRLDQIAVEINPEGDYSTEECARKIRKLRDTLREEALR